MKYGDVVRMRLTPQDAMGCIDILKSAGAYSDDMSLSLIASLALRGLLESSRRMGVIPYRDGFEYSAMVQPLLEKRQNAKKLAVTEIAERNMYSRLVNDVSAVEPVTPVPQDNTYVYPVRSRLEVRLNELRGKKVADIENWSVLEEAELQHLEERIRNLTT